MRKSGVLLAISSLPSKYGIGCFSKEAYEFVDFLKKAGQSYWQILPLGQTGYGDSPYQSFSTFAGNPYFIDPVQLKEDGLLTMAELRNADFGIDPERVSYGKLYENRLSLLKKAFQRAEVSKDEEFLQFRQKQAYWAEDYALYMAVKKYYNNKSWDQWEEGIRMREKREIERFSTLLSDEITFYIYLQYLFYSQWEKLKKYANAQGVEIIGDIPIYVSFDSADAWAGPDLFQFDIQNRPIAVAGCPPDGFSDDGQLWGNPLYAWGYHKRTGYEWWISRVKYCLSLYDVLRIDHFRGFDEYYSIPFGEKTAQNGHWEKGPGMDLFNAIKDELGDVRVIAEDLGFITDSVKTLVEESGFPNMKILEFAFDSRESGDYMPYTYGKNSVVYTGTHDNNTIKGWLDDMIETDLNKAQEYLQLQRFPISEWYWQFIRLAMQSTPDTCIIPMQDYLGLGSKARMNIPATLGTNWQWRMKKGAASDKLAERIHSLTKICGR